MEKSNLVFTSSRNYGTPAGANRAGSFKGAETWQRVGAA